MRELEFEKVAPSDSVAAYGEYIGNTYSLCFEKRLELKSSKTP